MPWIDVIWTEENESHIADAGLTITDVEHALRNRLSTLISRTSGRPIAVGETPDGQRIAVVYEQIDELTVYPVTAYRLED